MGQQSSDLTVSSGDGAADEGHVHTDECYARVLKCKTAEHAHEDLCYEETYCGIGGHTHKTECYDEEDTLICEIAEHKHIDNCYKEPHCGVTVHIHDKDCSDEEGNLTCDKEEHVHIDECYISNTYFCTERIHVHDNDCYDLNGELICGSADYWAHVHGEACYNKNERLICTMPETEEDALHTHGEECYGVRGVLICGQTEVLFHEHDENCRIEPSEIWIDNVSAVAYCGMGAHVHRNGCMDREGNPVCGLEEHTHTDECFEEPGHGCMTQIHIHEAACYDEAGNIQCGEADYVLHAHSTMCYGYNGKLLCTLPEIPVHVHGTECYAETDSSETESAEEAGTTEVLICTLPETVPHEHGASCCDENGDYVCGMLQAVEHVHTDQCVVNASEIMVTQTCKGSDFIVTATYNKKEANLPAEAKFFAQRITAEENEAYYEERAAQYQEMQDEDEESTMQALLKVGFAVDGVEVEPEAPVTIKVQFLDENGLADGSPVTVVHFGEEGTERLTGSDAEKNGTSFQMDSFSEIALGWKVAPKTIELDKTFHYESDVFQIKFHVEGEAILPTEEEIQKAKEDAAASENTEDGSEADSSEDGNEVVTNDDLVAVVELKEENEKEYEAVISYAEEIGADDEILDLQVLSYALTYEGAKLDLTGCKVTMDVTPSEALMEYAEEKETNVMAIEEPDLEDGTSEGEDEISTDVSLVAGNVTNEEGGSTVYNICSSLTLNSEAADSSMTYEVVAEGKDNVTTVYVSSQANPKFTVQFYANMKVFATKEEAPEGQEGISVIDTSGKGDGTGGSLPKNGTSLETKKIFINPSNAEENPNEVLYKTVEKEIYSEGNYEYVSAPGLVYFNKIAKNNNYVLTQIKIQRSGSTEWETYDCTDGKEWHFTNKKTTQETNPDFILITKDAVIRLMYDCVEKEVKNSGVSFYDYDTSDGQVYKANGTIAVQRDDQTHMTHDSGETWYMYTARQGINSNSPNQTFGFGNSESVYRSTMGEIVGNRANSKNAAYGSPTFGLVKGLKDGKIEYGTFQDEKGTHPVVAPNLFNDGDAHGKTTYVGNLIFSQSGDTYTLTGAEVVDENNEVISSKYNVDKFTRQRYNWSKDYYFAGNDFYPMDTVPSAGTGGHDLLFGSPGSAGGAIKVSANKKNLDADSLKAPGSDDALNHNHYFGMYYTVTFDLVKDYVGPLEYLFYGDDDMWVFLDGPGYSGRLICDIGGVHSAVGEYVNLWDYIEKGAEGEYKLSFFYTERGASGSTCWMQFTLPSVSFATTEQDIGKLQIQKQVTGNEETDEEFGFEIKFYEPLKDASGNIITNPTKDQILQGQETGNILKNDYSYTKYKKEVVNVDGVETEKDTVVESDVLIWNNSKFTLKANEYIVVSFLPSGSTYCIEEVGPVKVHPKEPGEDVSWDVLDNPYVPDITGGVATEQRGKIVGVITENGIEQIRYNNLYRFALPETGGSGTTILYALAGAGGILFGAGLMYRKKFRERRA